MKALTLNFAPTPLWQRLPRWQLALGALLLVTLCVGIAAVATEAATVASLEQQRRAQADRAAAAVPHDHLALTSRQLLAVNDAIRKLNLPWRDLFDAIEQAARADIALLSLEPQPEAGRILLAAEARTADDMLAYMQRLQRQPALQRVDLLGHKVHADDAARPLRFTLAVRWHAPVAMGGRP